ncbi:hypothetical protein BVC80_1543g74 [Macleaya cordata]|uniref:Protein TRIGALACTOSYLDIACYLGLYCEROL 4, chloroplastic n=1 Tax=Macleaya cordata TaxID=56857 RepID=A0A200R1U4_MACCD|nr:hypothetical protein BVC80_1543g74 [Macleaya cordata]
MKKLRWAMDGGFWDLDMSTPVTVDGLARPVPGDTIPLGLSRGTKLSRPKQIDFMQRFMAMPFVPSYAGDPARGGNGFMLQRVATFPVNENWFATMLGQFNIQKLVSSVKESGLRQPSESSWFKNIGKHLCDKSLYALGFCSEFLIGPDDTLLVSSDLYGDKKSQRNKAVFHHKASEFYFFKFFPQHNLTVEAVWPGLFVNKLGTYWDVPFLMEIDLASIASDSGSSCHVCVHHNIGATKQFDGDQIGQIPRALLPGFCVKTALSVKKNIDIWRSKAGKLKMVQPFDVFLSNPHVSASGCIGTVVTASFGDNSVRSQVEDESQKFGGFRLSGSDSKSSLLADLFATVSCTAQHGNFQRLVFDLTRLHARLDFPSGSKFLTGAAHVARDLYNSKPLDLQVVQAICPDITVSLQQQIFGEFSFRVDSRVALDLKSRERYGAHVDETVFAVEYALKVLGSAKAVAWYSTKHREAMVELRFFET